MKRSLSIKTKNNKNKKVAILTLIIIYAFFKFCFTACISSNLSSLKGERRNKILKSQNYSYTEKKFKNIYINEHTFQGSSMNVFKNYFFGNQKSVPDNPIDIVALKKDSFRNSKNNGLKITWLGHSSVLIELEDNIILFDPIFSDRPSPISFIGPKRYHTDLSLKIEDFPTIDTVVISHDHYDHLDYNTILKIHKKVKKFIVPLAVGIYLEKWGVAPYKIVELDWMQNIVLNKINFIATPAQHYSGRGPFSNYKTLWSSWVIITKKYRIFFSGDSGYNEKIFKKIGNQFGPFDVTLIECGQYINGLKQIHMLPEQALQAHLDVKGKVMIPIHWGAYNLANHDWYEPVERAVKGALKHNIIVATPQIGETYKYGKKIPTVKWWNKYKIKKETSINSDL